MTVASPCTRNCCLDTDDICMGCFRHLNEITGWSAKAEYEKKNVLAQCELRRQNKKQPKDI